VSEPRGSRERRCPNCGALVGPDATWCGQCFARLDERTEPAAPIEPDVARLHEPAGSSKPNPRTTQEATWPCAACGHENPIEADACSVCGSPFSALFKPEQTSPSVDPRTAVFRSLIFPGLGHAALGRGADGLVRGTMFVMVVGLGALAASTHPSSVALWILALYVLAAVAIYGFSAMETNRLAKGGRPWLSTKQLLWAIVGLVILSVMLLAGAIIAAPRGG
jgi:hypothetical protein